MKLYFTPGACSMAPHIVLREAGYAFDLEKVSLSTKRTAGGEDYARINPKGYVPALTLDDGQILTEVGVIVQYLADRKPASGLAPAAGTMDRYRLMEWLSFVATEIHKQISPLFNPKITPEWKEIQVARLNDRCDFLTENLAGKHYLMGDKFTVADAYLFTALSWWNLLGLSLDPWPVLKDYLARIAARPAVKETMKAEGLLK